MCPANICVPEAVDAAAAAQPALGDVDVAAEEVNPLAVVLADAANACEHHGWRLDSENEGGDSADDAAGIDDEDEDAGPGAVGRRRSRPGASSASSASLPAPAGERHPRFSGIRRDHIVWTVPGYGTLRYDTSLRILSAHCSCTPHGICRMNRTCCPGRRSAQGQPLGYLLAWLVAGVEHRVQFPDRPAHAELAVRTGVYASHASICYAQRSKLRRWAMTLRDMESFFSGGVFFVLAVILYSLPTTKKAGGYEYLNSDVEPYELP